MSKRTKLQLRNLRLYFKKYIFNSTYIVRNIIALTIMATVIALVGGVIVMVGSLDNNKENPKQQSTEQLPETTELVKEEPDEEIIKADEESIDQTVVEPNESEMVSSVYKFDFEGRFISVETDVNIRSEATTDSDIVGQLAKGNVGDIISVDGEWTKITSGQVTGYVKSEFILTGDAAEEYAKENMTLIGTVTESGVNIRSEASTEADIIGATYIGFIYTVDKTVTDTLTDWVCIILEDGTKGYVYGEYIKVDVGYTYATPVGTSQEDDSAEGTGFGGDSSSEPETEEPVTEESTTEESTTEEPEAEEPVTEEPTTEESTTEEPETEEPTEEETEEPDNCIDIETTYRDPITLTEEDINLIATIVALESGSEPYQGQLAVANVIINRLLSGRWGSTVSDVVYAPYQFSCVSSQYMEYYLENGAPATCVQATKEALAGTNNIGNFMSFRASYAANTSSYSQYTVIGNHVFFQ